MSSLLMPGIFIGFIVGALTVNTLWYWYVKRRYEPDEPALLNGDGLK